MCTALSLQAKDHYFGRNLDLDRSYGEEVCILPRRFPLAFRQMGELPEHHAMIGMATVADGIPLFYEAANEHGLAMAGLNFPGNAYYAPPSKGKDNIAPFELIPWILGQCKTLAEAEKLLSRIQIVNIAFSDRLPPSPLHWMLSDKSGDLVIEAMRDGLHIHRDPVGVLTNNPPFEQQLANWQNYSRLRNDNLGIEPEQGLPYDAYCQGLGAVGLPGDLSSKSRFVRAAFGRAHATTVGDELFAVGQFFHLLTSVEMTEGLCRTDAGTWDITRYSACINTDRGLYYYTTCQNRRISCIDLHKTEPDSAVVSRYPLAEQQSVWHQN